MPVAEFPGARNWGLTVQLYGLPSACNWGIGDFTDLGRITRSLHDLLDHKHLNDLLDNPPSERLALFVYQQAREQVEALGVRLAAVVVEETCTARCEFWP